MSKYANSLTDTANFAVESAKTCLLLLVDKRLQQIMSNYANSLNDTSNFAIEAVKTYVLTLANNPCRRLHNISNIETLKRYKNCHQLSVKQFEFY